jgi:hypothetical protein
VIFDEVSLSNSLDSRFFSSLSLSLSKRGLSSGGGYKKMKTDERDEAALFSSPLFLHSGFLFSLSCEVCVVYICSRVEYSEKFASAQAPRSQKKKKL